jgi:hypothetical protein
MGVLPQPMGEKAFCHPAANLSRCPDTFMMGPLLNKWIYKINRNRKPITGFSAGWKLSLICGLGKGLVILARVLKRIEKVVVERGRKEP